MRGKVEWLSLRLGTDGITPAHAGKSAVADPAAPVDEDHPRPCGEKHGLKASGAAKTRITPAHAGKRILPFLYVI